MAEEARVARVATRAVRHPAAATDRLPEAGHKADQEEKAAPVHQTAAEAVPDKNMLLNKTGLS